MDHNNILTLTITTTESAPVSYEVSSPYGSYYVTGTVSPSSHISINVDPSLTVTGSDVTQRSKGIRVRAADSSKTISVSGMTYEQHTADAFLALPSGPVAEEYTYIASSMLWTNRSETALSSLILIVGTLDNTLLTITPTQFVIIPDDLRAPGNPQNFVSPGESYTVTLNWLNTYQIESYLDLTGSRIVSNKPLSVFAGHQCADVPARVAACDHLYEQIPPTSTWGRFFSLYRLTLSLEHLQNGIESPQNNPPQSLLHAIFWETPSILLPIRTTLHKWVDSSNFTWSGTTTVIWLVTNQS